MECDLLEFDEDDDNDSDSSEQPVPVNMSTAPRSMFKRKKPVKEAKKRPVADETEKKKKSKHDVPEGTPLIPASPTSAVACS